MFLLKFSVWQTDKVTCIGTDTTGNVGTLDHYLLIRKLVSGENHVQDKS